MSRLAKNISIEEFKQKLIALKDEDECCSNFKDWELGAYHTFDIPQVEKDLSKIIFNNENVSFTTGQFNINCELGFHQINDLTFLLGAAGGDWESPVVFCLYVDNKNKIRGYVPQDGNTYDKRYKCAYGSQCEYTDMLPEDENKTNDELMEMFSPDSAPAADQEKLIADICNRIKVV